MRKVLIAAMDFEKASSLAKRRGLRPGQWSFMDCQERIQGLTAQTVWVDESAHLHPNADEILGAVKIRSYVHSGIKVFNWMDLCPCGTHIPTPSGMESPTCSACGMLLTRGEDGYWKRSIFDDVDA